MAVSNTAAEFILDLQDAYETEVEDVIMLVLQKFSMEALSRVVLKSPVDTGRFRGNWNVAIGSPDTAVSDTEDKDGSPTINRGASVITGMQEPEIVWVSNSLPYANRLENGWSQQAPGGVVALTFAELSEIVEV